MKIYRIAVPALAFVLTTTAIGIGAKPASAQDLDPDGQAPPRELNEVQQRGFHDGFEGARKDLENHRRVNVESRAEFRHPNLPLADRQAYREGYRLGYQAAFDHMHFAGGSQQVTAPPDPCSRDRWKSSPLNEVDLHGFEAGCIGAQRDVENHRRPDPGNRDDYRDPPVPFEQADPYRAGFRRGYEELVDRTFGTPGNARWDSFPMSFTEIGRRGFQDGIEGARHDVHDHRSPDPDNRDEYRNSNVPQFSVDDYREGFRLGYERAVAHFMNGTPGY